MPRSLTAHAPRGSWTTSAGQRCPSKDTTVAAPGEIPFISNVFRWHFTCALDCRETKTNGGRYMIRITFEERPVGITMRIMGRLVSHFADETKQLVLRQKFPAGLIVDV